MTFPKSKPSRSSAYLKWLRQRPCCWCGMMPPCEASHHQRHGMGSKAGDLDAIALCHRCHRHHHGLRFATTPPLPGAPAGFDVRAWAAGQAQELRALYEYEKH